MPDYDAYVMQAFLNGAAAIFELFVTVGMVAAVIGWMTGFLRP